MADDELDDLLRQLGEGDEAAPRDDAEDDASPIIARVDTILCEAVCRGATDVYLTPRADGGLTVQFRVEGALIEGMPVEPQIGRGAVTRVKIVATLDIAERRQPQRGLIDTTLEGSPLRARVCTMPTVWGEAVHIALEEDREPPTFEELGAPPAVTAGVDALLARRRGLILLTGGGEGVRAGLGAIARRVAARGVRAVVLSGYPPLGVAGLTETHLEDASVLDLSGALRGARRMAFEVVLAAPVHPADAAREAVRAALDDVLVVAGFPGPVWTATSIHTLLLDMGLEPWLVAEAVCGTLTVRPARRLCAACRHPLQIPPEDLRAELARFSLPALDRLYVADGCRECSGTGVRGTVCLTECLAWDGRVRRTLFDHPEEAARRAAAFPQGVGSLEEDGLAKLRAGLISAGELARALR